MQIEKEKLLEKVRSQESLQKNSQSGRHYQKFKMQKLKSPLFPIDSNLIRIKQITPKLLQETMLEDLRMLYRLVLNLMVSNSQTHPQ